MRFVSSSRLKAHSNSKSVSLPMCPNQTPKRRSRRRQHKPGSVSDLSPANKKPAKDSRNGRGEGHVHQWVSRQIGGGINRHLCETCGHISIDLSDTYSFEADPRSLLTYRR